MSSELTPKKVEIIQKWKYNSEDHSIVYPILKKYGVAPAENFVPYWMSPNIITAFGFMFTVVAFFICLQKDSFSVLEVHIICWCCFLAFFFDALDGEQGRKWRKDRRDVYVLTQLFDHGFDSLTTILNAFIVPKVLQLDLFGRKLVFLLLVFVFLVSSVEYKIRRVLIFGAFNNPTESVFLNIIMLTCSSLFAIPDSLKLHLVEAVFVCTILGNMYSLVKDFQLANVNERAEIFAVLLYFITVSLSLFQNDAELFTLQMIEYSLLYHVMELRIICCEIVKENCPVELFVFILPVLLLNALGVTNVALHASLIVVYGLRCVWLWYAETQTICKALKMSHAFSMPPVKNNPFQEDTKLT